MTAIAYRSDAMTERAFPARLRLGVTGPTLQRGTSPGTEPVPVEARPMYDSDDEEGYDDEELTPDEESGDDDEDEDDLDWLDDEDDDEEEDDDDADDFDDEDDNEP